MTPLWMRQVYIIFILIYNLTQNSAGERRPMDANEEETLAGGKNFEHSFGSVATGKLEMMIKMFRRYVSIKPELDKKIGSKVNFLLLFNCFYIYTQTECHKQGLSTSFELARSPNCSRFSKF